MPVEEFLKLVSIWRRYKQKFGGMFFLTHGVLTSVLHIQWINGCCSDTVVFPGTGQSTPESIRPTIFIQEVKEKFRKGNESTSLLCLRSGWCETDAGCFQKSAHSTSVSLDEAGVRWTFIPCQLPIHPTATTPIHRFCRASPLLSFLAEILFN